MMYMMLRLFVYIEQLWDVRFQNVLCRTFQSKNGGYFVKFTLSAKFSMSKLRRLLNSADSYQSSMKIIVIVFHRHNTLHIRPCTLQDIKEQTLQAILPKWIPEPWMIVSHYMPSLPSLPSQAAKFGLEIAQKNCCRMASHQSRHP